MLLCSSVSQQTVSFGHTFSQYEAQWRPFSPPAVFTQALPVDQRYSSSATGLCDGANAGAQEPSLFFTL